MAKKIERDCTCNSEFPTWDEVIIELEVTDEFKEVVRKAKKLYDDCERELDTKMYQLKLWNGWAHFKAVSEEEYARFGAETMMIDGRRINFSAYAKHTEDRYVSESISIEEVLNGNS